MFIVFEGADGVGKTTFVKGVEKELKRLGISVTSVGLPSNTPIGKEIRRILFDPEMGTKDMAKGVGTCLYMADFIQAQEKLIKPALAKGDVVLCDRWYTSEYAYNFIKPDDNNIYDPIWIAYQKAEFIKPDKFVLLTASSDVIKNRLNTRSKSDTKQAGKIWGDASFQTTVQKRYLDFFSFKIHDFKLLDVSNDDTTEHIQTVVNLVIQGISK